MKKTKRFAAGGGSGSMVPRDLAEEDSSLDVNYDKLKDLKAVTGLDKKLSTRAGRELTDEQRQKNTERIADIGLTAAAFGGAGPTIGKGAKAGAKALYDHLIPTPQPKIDWTRHPFKNTEKTTGKGRNSMSGDDFSKVNFLKKGGSVGSASKRADGIAQRGKTKGRMC
jgi:hypothetical protein